MVVSGGDQLRSLPGGWGVSDVESAFMRQSSSARIEHRLIVPQQ
jgi:hypothetical protein